MTPTNLCVGLTFLAFATCCFRARLVALSIAPGCLLIAARMAGLVDTSSASHPLRFAASLAGLSLAMLAAFKYSMELRAILSPRLALSGFAVWLQRRALAFRAKQRIGAAVLVFASACTDIPALFFWRLPGEWVLVPLQIAVCAIVIAVLLVPERWVL